MAFSHGFEERELWMAKYRDALTRHRVLLERVLKTYMTSGFVQALSTNTGVDYMKDQVFTWGWMEE